MTEIGTNPKLPTWDGDWRSFSDYKLACWLEHDGLKQEDQITLAPRLTRNLTGKAWEACVDIDREKLRKEKGLEYLLEFLKGKRGKQQVDILGEAFEKYFQSGEVVRKDKENLNDFEQRLAVFTRDIERALTELGVTDKVPSEIYGWFLLNKHVRLEPSDVATLKSQTASYKLPDVLQALRKMWGGESLVVKDGERHRGKAYMAVPEDGGDDDYEPVWFGDEDEQAEDVEAEEPSETEEWFETALAALQEQPGDEAILANFQEAKKAFYKDARRALDQNRVNRGFYPMSSKGKGKGNGGGRGDSKSGEFRGRCMRCGKYGHKAQSCPQTGGGKGKHSGRGAGVGYVYTNWTTAEPDGQAEVYLGKAKEMSKAILDCGASESIVGAWTLQKFCEELEQLGFDPEAEVDFDTSLRKSFIFGNNQTSLALGQAQVTAGIHGEEQHLQMHVVEGQTPLLLSSKWLYDQEAIIDFRKGQAILPKISSEIIQLERTPTYHLLLPVTAFAGHDEARDRTTVVDKADESVLLRACAQVSDKIVPAHTPHE